MLPAPVVEGILTDAGYDVVGPVPNVEQALALLRSSRVDAAVLDINMNGAFSCDVVPCRREVEGGLGRMMVVDHERNYPSRWSAVVPIADVCGAECGAETRLFTLSNDFSAIRRTFALLRRIRTEVAVCFPRPLRPP
jgi:CheY-like chemotaxis protein